MPTLFVILEVVRSPKLVHAFALRIAVLLLVDQLLHRVVLRVKRVEKAAVGVLATFTILTVVTLAPLLVVYEVIVRKTKRGCLEVALLSIGVHALHWVV